MLTPRANAPTVHVGFSVCMKMCKCMCVSVGVGCGGVMHVSAGRVNRDKNAVAAECSVRTAAWVLAATVNANKVKATFTSSVLR